MVELSKEDLQNDLQVLKLGKSFLTSHLIEKGHRIDILKAIQELKGRKSTINNNNNNNINIIITPSSPIKLSPSRFDNDELKDDQQVVVLTRQIAKGGFGTVWLGRWKANQTSDYREW